MKTYRIMAWALIAMLLLGIAVVIYSVVTSNNSNPIIFSSILLIGGSIVGTFCLKRAVAQEHELQEKQKRQKGENLDDESDRSTH